MIYLSIYIDSVLYKFREYGTPMLNNFSKATQLESKPGMQAENSVRKIASAKASATNLEFQGIERPMQWEQSVGWGEC